eukprot:TRINITY_DN4463_c0_g2_i1.p2 TRINITY_DN4463_c0_g2~~TRINITY_DN4463_c0_g2_i1.p2  ORF type:complete len:180 (+),score=30.53 TRINITY_DN4463_c0_g2_i1:328-867(+)
MWEDQPVGNSRNLAQRLGDIVLDWKSIYLATSKSTLQSFFKSRISDVDSSVPRVSSEVGEERQYCGSVNTPTLCSSSGLSTTPGVAEEHGSSETPDTAHDCTDHVMQSGKVADNLMVGKDKLDGPQHGSRDPGKSQFQNASMPLRGHKQVKQQPAGMKRKENPGLKSSNITSFFKRASQ